MWDGWRVWVRHENHWGDHQDQSDTFSFQNFHGITGIIILLPKLMLWSIWWVYSVHTVHNATILICNLIFGSILILVLKNYIVLMNQGWLNYLFTGRSLYPTENKNGTDNGTIITKQYLVSDLVGFFRMKTIQFPQNMTCLVCTEITNACNTSST